MEQFSPSILSFDVLASTNDYIKKNHAFLKNHTVVQTMSQSHGRGQFSRAWESDTGKNLLCSLLLKEDIPQSDLMLLSSTSVETLLAEEQISAVIKPPNDIYVEDKKIAGILIERIYEGQTHLATVIGLGLNVNQETFLTENATSMAILSGKDYDVYSVLLRFLDIFKNKYESN